MLTSLKKTVRRILLAVTNDRQRQFVKSLRSRLEQSTLALLGLRDRVNAMENDLQMLRASHEDAKNRVIWAKSPRTYRPEGFVLLKDSRRT